MTRRTGLWVTGAVVLADVSCITVDPTGRNVPVLAVLALVNALAFLWAYRQPEGEL